MTNQTAEIISAIKSDIQNGVTRIMPASFSHFYGRANTSAAFRIAKQSGLIKVAYKSSAGTPVYAPA